MIDMQVRVMGGGQGQLGHRGPSCQATPESQGQGHRQQNDVDVTMLGRVWQAMRLPVATAALSKTSELTS
jgi:hypothetical protein